MRGRSHCCVRAECQQTPLPLCACRHAMLVSADRFPKRLCARGRAAYVGVNTWDLMDKARYVYNRDEVSARLDAMVKAGWGVGRTWGFSLGDGLTNGIMGTTVADKNKILETGPGALLSCMLPLAGARTGALLQAPVLGLRLLRHAAKGLSVAPRYHAPVAKTVCLPEALLSSQACGRWTQHVLNSFDPTQARTMRRCLRRWTGCWTRPRGAACASSSPSRCAAPASRGPPGCLRC